jgi:hypothetical protein
LPTWVGKEERIEADCIIAADGDELRLRDTAIESDDFQK